MSLNDINIEFFRLNIQLSLFKDLFNVLVWFIGEIYSSEPLTSVNHRITGLHEVDSRHVFHVLLGTTP